MICGDEIHVALKEVGVLECLFCRYRFMEEKSIKDDLCCDKRDIINDDGKLVCRSCGIVSGFEFARECVNFHQNRYRFVRKSVYHRKYHIKNKLFEIINKYGILLNCRQREAIERVFEEIGKIVNQVNGKRKRLISVNFIIRKLIIMMVERYDMMGIHHEINYEEIEISKSKKTLDFYDKYWDKIMEIIGDKIKAIMRKFLSGNHWENFFMIFFIKMVNTRTRVYHYIINCFYIM